MPRIYTIGHSTRASEELLELLSENGIELLVDVRTAPGSRRMPHFNRDQLAPVLEARGVEYIHMKDLGGLRRPRRDSVNTGWRNDSFRGYADYMGTSGFAAGLDDLQGLARRRVTAIMCAEAVPWRCHRSLIADALSVRGWEIMHILGPRQLRPHERTGFARVEGTSITYPPVQEELWNGHE